MKMHKNIFLLLVCFFCEIKAQFDVGDPCEINKNKTGVCQYYNNCEYALTKITVDKDLTGIEICSWENRTSIVCCPDGDKSHLTGPYSLLFEEFDSDTILNKDTICWYKGVLPLLCCPKTPDFIPPQEPEGCPPLPQVKTPIFENRAQKIAWKKCVGNRQLLQICVVDNSSYSGYSRWRICNIVSKVQRIATDDPAGSAANPKEFPHMAVLGCNGNQEVDVTESGGWDIRWVAGGSLISERYILTAGHVLKENAFGPLRYALLGVLDKTDVKNGELYYIVRRIPYKTYVATEKHDDIALLELNRQVKFSEFIYPICLPVPGMIYDKRVRIIAGWGQTGYNKNNSDILLKAYINEINSADCMKYLKVENSTWDDSTMICARGLKPLFGQWADSCQGDSGGPLMAIIKNEGLKCNYVIVGVVSWGPNCGIGDPGAYTRVSPYVSWIVDNIWSDKHKMPKDLFKGNSTEY